MRLDICDYMDNKFKCEKIENISYMRNKIWNFGFYMK